MEKRKEAKKKIWKFKEEIKKKNQQREEQEKRKKKTNYMKKGENK